jgi:glycine betaine/proline transport system ATP-binding protein
MVDYGEMAYTKTDGPRSALHKMRKLKTSSIFVRKNGKLDGLVFARDASKARDRGEKTLEPVIKRNIPTVTTDTVANQLFPILADIDYPLAVVDEKYKLKGIVVRGALLAALSENSTL